MVSAAETAVVEEIKLTNTLLRKSDNSLLVVPNNNFVKDQVTNWSRTPYRVFKTSVPVAIKEAGNIDEMMAALREKLSSIEGVETKERDLVIGLIGFDEGDEGRPKVIVEVKRCVHSLGHRLSSRC